MTPSTSVCSSMLSLTSPKAGSAKSGSTPCTLIGPGKASVPTCTRSHLTRCVSLVCAPPPSQLVATTIMRRRGGHIKRWDLPLGFRVSGIAKRCNHHAVGYQDTHNLGAMFSGAVGELVPFRHQHHLSCQCKKMTIPDLSTSFSIYEEVPIGGAIPVETTHSLHKE